MRGVVVITFTLALALGCGTTTGGAAGGGVNVASGAPIAIETLPDAIASAMCAATNSCPSFGVSFSSEAVCKAYFADNGDMDIPDLADKVKEGKIAYDSAKAGECLKALATGCFEKEPEACAKAFVGKVKAGEACTEREECEPGTSCKQKDSSCPGVCTKLPVVGEACPDFQCAQGAACSTDMTSGTSTCVADTPVAEGKPCGSLDCAEGLYCDWSSPDATCKKKGAAGAACEDDDACGAGLHCHDDVCAAIGKEGEACSEPGSRDACAAGLVCAVVGKMSAKKAECLPIKKIGDACTSHQQCAAIDLECKGLDVTSEKPGGTCAALPKLGEACTPAGDTYPQFPSCNLGASCDPATKACVGPAAEGAACGGDSDRDCAKGLDCDDSTGNGGTCVKPQAPVCE